MNNTKKKFTVPTTLGIASVWFGTHMGPGTASGAQVKSFYSIYGKLGIFTPILAMSLLGLAIYFALEYSRINEIHDFKTFTNKFFHPYEKVFGAFFEITFIAICLLSPGVCIATGAKLLQQSIGLNMWVGTAIIASLSLILAIYGSNLIKIASTFLTFGILAILASVVVLGINSSAADIAYNWANTSTTEVSVWGAIVSALAYCGFQATGNIANCISVSDGLNSRADSIKTAVFGTIINTALVISIAVMIYGFQPDSVKDLLPNYYIINQLGKPFLNVFYILLVTMAALSTIITLVFSALARYGKFIKIKNEKVRNIVFVLIMLTLDIIVSSLGITTIINVGFKYLGYLSVPFVVFPIIFVGLRKSKSLENKNLATNYKI